MSRAFVREDDAERPGPGFDLPPRDAPHYDEAAARALIEGAHRGDTRSAEEATGYRWGESVLVPHVERLLEQAVEQDDLRLAQLARRYL
ncbi:MAG: hypothetical protein D6701_03630, partial [Gemmatimonadetes bacterium]